MGPGSPPTESIFCFEAVAEEAERPKTALDVQRASQSYLNGIAELKRMGESEAHADESAQHDEDLLSKIIYVCTSCGDAFEDLTAWKAHEKSIHELQYYWNCPYPACDEVFSRAEKFEAYHEEAHACVNCSHANEVVRRLPSKRVWGCGFDMCQGVFDNWEQRCAHVAIHYEGFAEQRVSEGRYPHWRYTNMMRNLLRQAAVKDVFRSVMVRYHGESMVSWPRLQWRPSDSGELRRRLEYCDFRNGVEEIAQLAYRLGHPAAYEARNIEGMTAALTTERPAHKRSPPSLSLFPPQVPSLENVIALATQQAPEDLPPNPAVRPLESLPQTPRLCISAGINRPLHSHMVSISSNHNLVRSSPRNLLVRSPLHSHTVSIVSNAPAPELVPSNRQDRNRASSLATAPTESDEYIDVAAGPVQSPSNSIFSTSELVHPFNAGLNATEVYLIHRPTDPLPLPSPTLSQFPSPPGMGEKILKRAKSLVRRDNGAS